MVSTLEYTTLAAVEAYAKKDYSAINAYFSDANVDATISDAEAMINSYIGTAYTSATIPSDLALVTKLITVILLDNRLPPTILPNGAIVGQKDPFANEFIRGILDTYREQYRTPTTGVFVKKNVHYPQSSSGYNYPSYHW